MTRNVLSDCFTFCNTIGRMGDGGRGTDREEYPSLRVRTRADVNEQLLVEPGGEQVYSWLPSFLSDGSENVRVESPLYCYWPGRSAELIRQRVQLAC